MNIKNAEAVELAAELAAAEGISLTDVVLQALRAWKRARESESIYLDALEICRDTAPRLSGTQLSLAHGDLLYDDYGLPA
ncbi:MAG: type II toxin-antitoxin system VapB family antitoxin [Sphingomonas sp.]|nr:type II toxin-antitoxin system VapB family antitoxin [Sphingomonas sp.]